ncbi:ABC transporter permease [Candidatus Woesearchaeota archaeon]|nr:ABC transporter permease [Candidatus Woesearchaeota archaeon]
MLKDYFLHALKGIRQRRLRSWLTLIGIFIGIAAVVSLISLAQGLKEAVIGQFASIGSDRILIQNANTGFGPPGSTDIRALTKHDKEIIEKTKGIEIAVSRLLRTAQINFKDESKVQFAASWPEKKEEMDFILSTFSFSAEKGRLLKPGDKFKVVVGNDYSTKSIFSKKIAVNDKLNVKGFDFEVVGILAKTGNPQFDSVVIIMEEAMKKSLNIGDEIDIIAAKAAKGQDALKAAEELSKNLRNDRKLKRGYEDFEVQTPQQIIRTFDTVFFIVQAVIVGIAFISLLVGAVGITNTMYTAVLERTREIGIMKAIGAKNSSIFTIFFIESGLLGMSGGLIGIILGFALSKLAENIGKAVLGTELLTPIFPLPLIIGALLFSFLVGTISGLLPALQASKLNPVDALRYR